MAIQQYKPTTNGRRGQTSQDFSDITTRTPVKGLVKIKKSNAGRNNQGRITTRHRGGGVKQFYRLMNHQLADGTVAVVEHSSNISIGNYTNYIFVIYNSGYS